MYNVVIIMMAAFINQGLFLLPNLGWVDLGACAAWQEVRMKVLVRVLNKTVAE